MPVALSVAVFGALGSLARYAVDRLIEQHTAFVFPLSTFVVNVTGCVVAGVAVGALDDSMPGWVSVGVLMGFLGAYTTFSTFAVETHDLLEVGHLGLALANVVASFAAGLAAVSLGLFLAGR